MEWRGAAWCVNGSGILAARWYRILLATTRETARLMQRFTQTTVVEPATKIRQERLLPAKGEVVVRVGQQVSPVQVVARAPQDTDFYILPASDLLQIPPGQLSEHLLVEAGSTLEQGTPLVQKQSFLGGKNLVSPVEGILYEVRNGRLVLQQISDWIELRAMVQGRIVSQVLNRGVVIEVSGSLIQAVWGSGKEGYGKIKVVTETADTPFTAEHISGEALDHAIVVGRVTELSALKAAEENDVRGLIAGSMPTALCQRARAFSFPIILTDGIGNQGMATPIFQLLRESEEREATLFARPPDRSGRRPEIVIPLDTGGATGPPPLRQPLAIGQTVRVLRPPYASQVGEIVKLYTHLQPTPINTRSHGAEVKLTDGQVVFVPYANLDAII